MLARGASKPQIVISKKAPAMDVKLTKRPKACADCPARGSCRKICKDIEAQLPGMREGEGHLSFGDRTFGSLWSASRITDFWSIERYREFLSPREWAVVEGKFIFGYSEAQIAKILGVSRSSVQKYWMRAKRKIPALTAFKRMSSIRRNL